MPIGVRSARCGNPSCWMCWDHYKSGTLVVTAAYVVWGGM